MSAVRPIQKKDQTGVAFKEIIVEMESFAVNWTRVRRIIMDSGGKFIGDDLKSWFTNSEIIPKYSPPYSPESNGRAEMLNRMILNMARTMKTPLGPGVKNLWSKVVATSYHICIRMFRSGLQLGAVTIIEGLTGIKPNVSHLQ